MDQAGLLASQWNSFQSCEGIVHQKTVHVYLVSSRMIADEAFDFLGRRSSLAHHLWWGLVKRAGKTALCYQAARLA